MSLNLPHMFVAETTAVPKRPDEWRAAGFGTLIVEAQVGDRRRADMADKIIPFRDWARSQGFKVAAWVNLEQETPFDYFNAGQSAGDLAPHFDGIVVDAEAKSYPHTGKFLDGYVSFSNTVGRHLGLSCLPTLPYVDELAARWDNLKAFLMPQAYSKENWRTPKWCYDWATLKPTHGPIYVGWRYRATVNGKGRRVFISYGRAGEPAEVAVAFDGRYGVEMNTRKLFKLTTGARQYVGRLDSVWNMTRFAPTVRVTGYPTMAPSASELHDQAEEILPNPTGIYLLESADWDFFREYR